MDTPAPKYPDVTVLLTGKEGPPHSIISRVQNAMRLAEVDPAEITAFIDEAVAADPTTLQEIAARWVTVV